LPEFFLQQYKKQPPLATLKRHENYSWDYAHIGKN